MHKYLWAPGAISRRGFYPFLKTQRSERRYKKATSGIRIIDHKKRELFYASHMDATVLTIYARRLSERYEKSLQSLQLSDSVLAYRSLKRSNIHFAQRSFEIIGDRVRAGRDTCAIGFDIEGFFDHLPHKTLKEEWSYILGHRMDKDDYQVFKLISKYSFVEKELVLIALKEFRAGRTHHRASTICSLAEFKSFIKPLIQRNSKIYGIPQGSPISGMLSNICMLGFDVCCNQLAKHLDAVYFRYSDDILLICDTHQRPLIEEKIHSWICSLRMEINPSKTLTSCFSLQNDGSIKLDKIFGYLGLEFDGINISLRSKTLSRFWRKFSADKKKFLNSDKKRLWRIRILHRYGRYSRNSFMSYALRAWRVTQSETIKHQIKKPWRDISILLSGSKPPCPPTASTP